jgi:hypothetical protein
MFFGYINLGNYFVLQSQDFIFFPRKRKGKRISLVQQGITTENKTIMKERKNIRSVLCWLNAKR